MVKMIRSAAVTVLAALIAIFMCAGTAAAAEPVHTTGPVTDETGSVSDVSAIESSLESLQDATGYPLRVVFVDTFDSYNSDQWAEQSFIASGLSQSDSLLAVAIDSRQFSVYAGGSGFTVDELQEAVNSTAVLDKWRDGDWSGGISELTQQLAGADSANVPNSDSQDSGRTSQESSSSSAAIWFLLLIVLAGGIFLIVRSRRKKVAVAAKASTDLRSLQKQASAALLAADDGVRAAAGELEFARAEFGIEATRQFSDALTRAKSAVQQAFEIQKKLDDDTPETPAQQSQMNAQIVALTAQAQQAIAEQERDFQQMRDLSSRVMENLDEQETRVSEIAAQLDSAEPQLQSLKVTYPASALESLSTYPAQARALLDAATKAIQEGRAAGSSGDKSKAVPYARIAEDALRQARVLADQCANARTSLAEAQTKVAQGIASLSADISDAKRLGQGDSVIAARQADAEKAVTYASGSGIDPFRALDQLTQAENALDAVLTGVRSAEQNTNKARELADRNRSNAQAVINEADTYIDRYTHYVPQRARTQLAAAQASFAAGDANKDPREALPYYEQAKTQAQDALNIARNAVSDESQRRSGGMSSPQSGTNWGSILGGMIIGSLLSGGGHHHGGFSSGSFGGGFSGGGGFGGGGFGGGFGGGRGGGFGGSF